MVLRMEEETTYFMLLGRPWLIMARVKKDWVSESVRVRVGKKKYKLLLIPKKTLPRCNHWRLKASTW